MVGFNGIGLVGDVREKDKRGRFGWDVRMVR